MKPVETTPSLMQAVLSAHSPIRDLLKQSEQIGAIYRLKDFSEALIITNDAFVQTAHGVPQHAFLLAAAADLAGDGNVDSDDEEVILLRVCGNAPLPQENDLQYLRAQAGIDLVTEDGMATPRPRHDLIDPLTENQMQTAGLTCTILGTFYDIDGASGPTLAFGSDIDNVYASTRLRVFKPYGSSLSAIVGFMAESVTAEERHRFRIGNVRYASTRRREKLAATAGKSTDVPVEIDIADFVAHKTAVLGMTRKGKSNTNKVLATMTHQYSKEHGVPIGQLIFDPAGEYANENTQDKTALAALGPEHVTRFRLGATAADLAADPGLRMLALNFFDEKAVGVVWGLVGQFLSFRAGTQYVDAFVNANIEGPENPQSGDDYRELSYARRARMLVYACFMKAGLEAPTSFAMWVPIKASVRASLVVAGGPRGEDLSFLDSVPTSKKGDQIKLDADQLQLVSEAMVTNFFSDNSNTEIDSWMDTKDQRLKHVGEVLLGRAGGGYKILFPLREGYHSPAASEDYAPAIYKELVNGKIVIVDLARGSEGVLQFASERILNHLLSQSAERFRANKEPRRIQVFLEEAHRLFDREKFQGKIADTDPYVRLAREAGKYKIGMIYSTQQVSSVENDVLDNTANWIIAHLNSQAEVKRLEGRYDLDRFAEQILKAEDPGFIRLKTQSSRYVIPVQVRLFDQAMVDNARDTLTAAKREA